MNIVIGRQSNYFVGTLTVSKKMISDSFMILKQILCFV
ncbi:hypothetical protein LEP1GSC172_0393 [Leptospira noguchii]|uniref:Uncharacterized protein n=2 Tax=Leptospira noguchii TaxID=28182 RepID=T0FFK2_9LEPT|nr:hypothetical protein LEP1GSC172_0393 [Leptospira noguchii]EQA72033.1 hypothetical protein LEP1GSC059_4328 [Leptospira noguchii serovar Panama str. CZ214]